MYSNEEKKQIFINLLTLFGPYGEKWVDHCPTSIEEQNNQHCILTGICNIMGEGESYNEVYNTLYRFLPKDIAIGKWNDSHTFDQVRELINKTIQSL